MPELILASTSPYRRDLLARLRLPFSCVAPDFVELDATSGLVPSELVRHNTLGKGRAVAERFPAARVIASDQLAACEGKILGKPGNAERAAAQLRHLSGRSADFLTGIALLADGREQFDIVPCRVVFRSLDAEEIARYLAIEAPFDCAGSFKSEGLGIALFDRIESLDPTALIGLPLIRLCQMLHLLGDPAIGRS